MKNNYSHPGELKNRTVNTSHASTVVENSTLNHRYFGGEEVTGLLEVKKLRRK
jgi:hypothetical protein